MRSNSRTTQGSMEEGNQFRDDGTSKYSIHFSEASIRAGFIRKVFAIVTIMLAVVAAFCAIPIFHEPLKLWLQVNWWVWLLAAIMYVVLYYTILCCPFVGRAFPTNVIILAAFTISASIMTMCFTSRYETNAILLALCTTTVCTACVVLFACTTNADLTSMMGIACLLSLFVFVFGFFAMGFAYYFGFHFLHTVYSGLGALVTMFWLGISIQLVMGGKKFEISPEDYIFGAVLIFVQILELFHFILSLLGRN